MQKHVSWKYEAKTKFPQTYIEVDTWQVTHNTEGTIIETFEGKTNIKEVKEMLYLGAVISCDGKNSKNILHKQNRALGTQIKKVYQWWGG